MKKLLWWVGNVVGVIWLGVIAVAEIIEARQRRKDPLA